MLVALKVGLHFVCSLLQPQPAALAHAAFGKFLDTFQKGETDREAAALAVKMVNAMAQSYGNARKDKPKQSSDNKSPKQSSDDLELGITGDTDLIAMQPTL